MPFNQKKKVGRRVSPQHCSFQCSSNIPIATAGRYLDEEKENHFGGGGAAVAFKLGF